MASARGGAGPPARPGPRSPGRPAPPRPPRPIRPATATTGSTGSTAPATSAGCTSSSTARTCWARDHRGPAVPARPGQGPRRPAPAGLNPDQSGPDDRGAARLEGVAVPVPGGEGAPGRAAVRVGTGVEELGGDDALPADALDRDERDVHVPGMRTVLRR